MPNKPKNKQTTGAKRVVLDEKIELSIEQIVEEAMKSWKLEYLQEIEGLKAEIREIKSSQEFITAKYDDLKLDYDNLILKNKKQEEEIKSLQTSSQLIAENEAKEFDKIDALEQCTVNDSSITDSSIYSLQLMILRLPILQTLLKSLISTSLILVNV